MHAKRGIRSLYDYRFAVVAGLYMMAMALFYQTGGDAGLSHVVLPGIISFLAVSDLGWRRRVLGPLTCLPCVLLHIPLFIALVFMLNRTFTITAYGSVGDFIFPDNWRHLPQALIGLAGSVVGAAISALGFLFASTAFAWFGTFFFLLGTMAAVLLRKRYAQAVFAVLFCVSALISVAYNPLEANLHFLGGIACMAAALYLQYEEGARRDYWHYIVNDADSRWPEPQIYSTIKIDLLEIIYKEGRIAEGTLRHTAARRLECGPNDARLPGVCRDIVTQLVFHDRLAAVKQGKNGQYISLDEDMLVEKSPLTQLAITLQAFLLALVTVVYVVSPVDLIPDSVPMLGILDDAVIGALGGMAAWKTSHGDFGSWHIDKWRHG